jgi:hypothetical protein
MSCPLAYSMKRLLLVVTAFAIVVAIGAFLSRNMADAHIPAVRNQYLRGQITLEQARKEVGSEADSWVEFKNRRPE